MFLSTGIAKNGCVHVVLTCVAYWNTTLELRCDVIPNSGI